MGKLKQAILLSFRAKVLVPVLGVMVLMMVVSMWLVNRRYTHLVADNASRQLATAEAVMNSSQQIRVGNLKSRFRSTLSEPRWKSLALLLKTAEGELSPETKRTCLGMLDELLKQNVADFIMLSTGEGRPLVATYDERLQVPALETDCCAAIEQAANDRTVVDVMLNSDRLFDIVTVPIRTGEQFDVVGTVTFGVTNTMAQEFAQLTHDNLALYFNGKLINSTLPPEQLGALAAGRTGTREASPANGEIMLSQERFLALSGRINYPSGRSTLSYTILSSLEKPLAELAATQRQILLASIVAVLAAATLMWIFVRRVTGPLEELRASVEAVGRGDFSRRINVPSQDECGELAAVFNQMTENLKQSREQLELTVASLKATQTQLIQSEKLSGIGEFVAGVAHELNNPLTSVMGFSELLRTTNSDPKLNRHLEMIHKSALRCQRIVQSLLSFARRHQPEKKLTGINKLLEGAVEFLAYQLRTSSIEVHLTLDPNLPQAFADPHQLQQVFVNIINNARQAIEAHSPKGWVRVSSERHGDLIELVFQDSGPGIPETHLSKIFDPFFTTKEVGKGTGLGLSLCYGIIKEHGGNIRVESRPGEGARFIIDLPVAAPAAESPGEGVTTFFTKPATREGEGKRVLIVDDELPILEVLSETLGEYGYDVETVSNGEAALQRLTRNRYDLALCDWKMPGLSGRAVYEQLQTVNPEMCQRMIFITGDVINERTQNFLKSENRACLSKPFSLAEFRAAVKAATTTTC